ncbi:hypothetical protein KFK09_020051 [Dendrobium nobile]|uniref:Uncharacterized protein n=1 Tax=Dendrobium nobile TaxID=94219 RepID=A0A8T3AS79_DENNO|nr:hypothetical protein KFK09_020051 [Dendrobium nobile]
MAAAIDMYNSMLDVSYDNLLSKELTEALEPFINGVSRLLLPPSPSVPLLLLPKSSPLIPPLLLSLPSPLLFLLTSSLILRQIPALTALYHQIGISMIR